MLQSSMVNGGWMPYNSNALFTTRQLSDDDSPVPEKKAALKNQGCVSHEKIVAAT